MSGYIGTQPVPQATQTRDAFTATAGQTIFATGGYTPQFLDVYLNGIFLANGADYAAANGSDVILTAGAAAGDILEVVAYTTFEVANVTSAHDFTVTGSFTSQALDVTGTVTATAFSGDGSALTGIAAGATGGGNDDIFYENGQNVTTNYTITNGKNAMSAGPITIDSGVTVTVGAGEAWTVI